MKTGLEATQDLSGRIAELNAIKHDESIFQESYDDVKADTGIGYIYRRNELDKIKGNYSQAVKELYAWKVKQYVEEVEKICPNRHATKDDVDKLSKLLLFPESEEKNIDSHESILEKLISNEEETTLILQTRNEFLSFQVDERHRKIIEKILELKKDELDAFARIRAGGDYFEKVLHGEKDIGKLNNMLFNGRIYQLPAGYGHAMDWLPFANPQKKRPIIKSKIFWSENAME